MRRSFLILLHTTLWIILILLTFLVAGIIYSASTTNTGETSYFIKIVVGAFIVPASFSFYSFYTFLFNRYLGQRKISKAVMYGLILAVIATLLGHIALYFGIGFDLDCQRESNFIAIPIMLLISIIFGSIALVFKGFLTWAKEIKLKEELLEKNHKTEMALVKSQLDPHFLFNTINNIDVLIIKDPNEASKYLNKLSDIMRFMLFETKTNKIPLSSELRYIKKYIELQKIRTSNSNYVSFEILGDPEGISIAPMIFIPFIENAFKHTDNKKIQNAIKIVVQIFEDKVTLLCNNKFSAPSHTTIGKSWFRKCINKKAIRPNISGPVYT